MIETEDRLAIVNGRCKPNKCDLQCKKICPVNRMGKECIRVTKTEKSAYISELLCNGCGLCIKKCPFGAITLVKLPKSIANKTTHRYGPNGFKLHKMPLPRNGKVLGLLGENGCGKTSVCKILAGALKPNLGRFGNDEPSWEEIIKYFRGSQLQNYFQQEVEGHLKVMIKPQHVTLLPKKCSGTISELLEKLENSDSDLKATTLKSLSLEHLLDRDISTLSGGELQRFAIAYTCLGEGQTYIFDEPCAFLDVKQRLNAARTIRSILDRKGDPYVVVVEHDISIMDYLCDYICILYGTGNAFGVVTQPFGVREGLNMFLEGYIRSENMRFRPEPLVFAGYEQQDLTENPVLREKGGDHQFYYPSTSLSLGSFSLKVCSGAFRQSQTTVLLGENGTGKTSFIKYLMSLKEEKTEGEVITSAIPLNGLRVSYKPQVLAVKSDLTVRQLLEKQVGAVWLSPPFNSEVIKPLKIMPIIDQPLKELSGGELQRVCVTACLGKQADVYLLDEPSTFLDVEQRVNLSKVIKRYMSNNKKTAFIVEHDLNMAAYIADRFIIFDGEPGIQCTANEPESWNTGLGHFLQILDLSMRKDPNSGRPRVNKPGSLRDREQKREGLYFTESNQTERRL